MSGPKLLPRLLDHARRVHCDEAVKRRGSEGDGGELFATECRPQRFPLLTSDGVASGHDRVPIALLLDALCGLVTRNSLDGHGGEIKNMNGYYRGDSILARVDFKLQVSKNPERD